MSAPHDVSVTRYMSHRIAVMYLGNIVEIAPAEEIIKNPMHPYTEALLSAVPVPDPTTKHGRVEIKGELPSPINVPKGRSFHPRCLYKRDICRQKRPVLRGVPSCRKPFEGGPRDPRPQGPGPRPPPPRPARRGHPRPDRRQLRLGHG